MLGKLPLQVLILVLAVLVVYFPSINDTINSIDDSHIIEAYGQRTLRQIFVPANQFYYRPLVELTYFLDNLLWGLTPRFMHLENVLLHLVNTLLTYSIAKRVAVFAGGLAVLPFMSALLFAIHPIVTEPVNWIAGRTDLLAATFILFAFLLLMQAVETGCLIYGFASCFLVICSFLVKETSLLLVPALLVLLTAPPVTARLLQTPGSARLYALMYSLFFCSAFLVGAAIVTRLFWKPVGSDNALSLLFKRYDIFKASQDLWVAFGFYTKKLIVPYPLNFAIDSVYNWYIFLGLLVLPLAVFCLRKRQIMTDFLFIALLFVLPAAAVKVAGITWTPVAERYLYIPTAFFCIGISGLVCSFAEHLMYKKAIYMLLVLAAVPVAISTYHRNVVWQDNLLLFQDTVDKSPYFGDVHNELGVALAKRERFDEARKHFEFAASHAKRDALKDIARFNLLLLELQNKSLLEKRSIVVQYRQRYGDFHENFLLLHRNILRGLVLSSELSAVEESEAYQELIKLNNILFIQKNDPQYLYHNGQYALIIKDKKLAYDYFSKVTLNAAKDSEYFLNSLKLMKSIASAK